METIFFCLFLDIIQNTLITKLWHRDFQPIFRGFHSVRNRVVRVLITTPRSPRHTVRNIPVQHQISTVGAVLAAVEQHTETTVHDFAPANSTTIV